VVAFFGAIKPVLSADRPGPRLLINQSQNAKQGCRYDKHCISYRLIAQSGPYSDRTRSRRVRGDDEHPDGTEHCRPVTLRQCHDHRRLCHRPRRRQRHLVFPGAVLSVQSPRQRRRPGGGVEKISASGSVYKLASVSDFAGRCTQSTGPAGFSSSGSSDLWLQNSAGVIMHLQGTENGAMLTLGKEEIFIRMAQQ
jgi:hypothetical protein